MKDYPRNGEGLEAYVDASDTGYTENAAMEEEKIFEAAAKKAGALNGANGHVESGIDGVSREGGKINGKVTGNGALSNGTTGNYANVVKGVNANGAGTTKVQA
jgi:3-dehydroquinate synthase